MEDNKVLLSKRVKILSIISICLSTLFMILFLLSVTLWRDVHVVIYIFMILFMASVIFEFIMCIFLFKYLYQRYVGKK
ncbi:MAG: hypothetical protein ACI35W_04165 [Anaeroplasmataceae bacterium]